jgi:hypothetical protein
VWDYIGLNDEAKRYRRLADRVCRNVYAECFDKEKGLIADTPDKKSFHDMTNVVAVLTDSIPREKQRAVIENIKGLGYSRWLYLADARKKVGLGDSFDDILELWKKALEDGMTTCLEETNNPRSDCHPWSTNPPVHYFRTICGIEAVEPGFARVRIEPALGKLSRVKASLPAPRGAIEVDLKRKGEKGIEGTVTLPESITGVFVWNGKKIQLEGGVCEVNQ